MRAIVDGRSPGVLLCALPPADPTSDLGFPGRAGRIPGSVNVPAVTLIDKNSGHFRFDGAFGQLNPHDGPVAVYCGGGIAASLDAFGLVNQIHQDVRVYDDSLNERALDPDAPMT
ncbi:rhodanese-like domain-containing protein [Gordonia sp. NPDC003504]